MFIYLGRVSLRDNGQCESLDDHRGFKINLTEFSNGRNL